MIITIDDLLEEYSGYKDIHGKIRRLVKEGKLIPIIRGLYETNKNTPGEYLAIHIYSPSYISFDTALSYHGLIPEYAYNYTCASFNKRKHKIYKTSFGIYLYQDIPKLVYPYDIKVYIVNGYTYHMATPEKAICDKLYSLSPVKNIDELEYLMFEDLRIDEDDFYDLDKAKLIFLAEKYKSTNLKLLISYLNGGK